MMGDEQANRKLDERVSFRKRDKIPYGMFVAYENLGHIFPKATILTSKQEPGYWDSLSSYEKDQALIIVSPAFNATEQEMKKLIRFAENGNDVFISTMYVPYEVGKMMRASINAVSINRYLLNRDDMDTLTVSLANPPFQQKAVFSYPGKNLDGSFERTDTAFATVLGYNQKGNANFIRLTAGSGHIFLHMAPMAYTNYFLLHKNNIQYYEKTLSLLSPGVKKIVWDEYYLGKKSGNNNENDANWLSVFLRYPALKWALITALLTLLVFVLIEMRRKQRYIPVISKPRNDSLEFVKTIGRLYHEKGDHKNLSRKMAAYFLEHVRNRYKLPTNELNETFMQNLQFKTGVDEAEIQAIVSFIWQLDQLSNVSDKQLVDFHRQLETFYKKA